MPGETFERIREKRKYFAMISEVVDVRMSKMRRTHYNRSSSKRTSGNSRKKN